MAAKQGLSAQLSQASEDAKRAVLNRTSLTTSLWFSNLNTTCTIKSAPPRTPEVLSLLSTKSGWLFKRNEQHVWQTRWCCVVPHTFLYYFDSNVLPGDAQPPVPTTAQQDDWNLAVRDGYGPRSKQQAAPRSSLYIFPTSGGGTASGNGEDGGATSPPESSSNGHHSNHPGLPPIHPNTASGGTAADCNAFATMQPTGIIDLECYTSVHRSNQNQLVMELAGDDSVNPDLRQFYFCAGSESETEDWTQALLGQRHTALMDETDAYKQVCDGFAQQLQFLHTELDAAQKQAEDANDELYQVRSQMEDARRNCWNMVEEALERSNHTDLQNATTNHTNGRSFRADLDAVRSQDPSLLAPVQLLCDYTRVLEDTTAELTTQNKALQEDKAHIQNSDHDRVQQLEQELQQLKDEHALATSTFDEEKTVLQQSLERAQKEVADLTKELASTKLEVTMYQSSTRNKMTELNTHKKILKKEVLDLRQKLEDALSELSLVKHQEKSSRLEVDQERKKADLLERYVDKMESQVKVQQNMMELMSASGVGSVVHGGSQAQQPFEVTVPRSPPRTTSNNNNVLLVNTPSSVGAEDLDEDEEDGIRHHHGRNGGAPPRTTSRNHYGKSPSLRRGLLSRDNDEDNKSHMSELTEDRTQKQFDFLSSRYEYDHNSNNNNGRQMLRLNQSPRGPTGDSNNTNNNHSDNDTSNVNNTTAPPSYIVGDRYSSGSPSLQQQQLLQNFQNPDSAKLDTILSSAMTATPPHSKGHNELLTNHPAGVPRHGSSSASLPAHSDIPPHQVVVDYNHSHHNHHHSSSRSLASTGSGRLSVAQRARLQADRQTTPVKVRSADVDKLLNKSQKQETDNHIDNPPSPERLGDRHHTAGSTADNNSQGARPGRAGFFSNIGRKLEAAIDKSVFSVDPSMGGGDYESDSDDSDDDISSKEDHHDRRRENNTKSPPSSAVSSPPGSPRRSSAVSSPGGSPRRALLTKESLDGLLNRKGSNNNNNHRSGGSLSNFSFRAKKRDDTMSQTSGYMSDEKKTPDATKGLTLAQRQQLQREQQLKFLKDQGLINEDSDVRGGAGAASPLDDRSVASNRSTTVGSTVSSGIGRFSPRRSNSTRL